MAIQRIGLRIGLIGGLPVLIGLIVLIRLSALIGGLGIRLLARLRLRLLSSLGRLRLREMQFKAGRAQDNENESAQPASSGPRTASQDRSADAPGCHR